MNLVPPFLFASRRLSERLLFSVGSFIIAQQDNGQPRQPLRPLRKPLIERQQLGAMRRLHPMERLRLIQTDFDPCQRQLPFQRVVAAGHDEASRLRRDAFCQKKYVTDS